MASAIASLAELNQARIGMQDLVPVGDGKRKFDLGNKYSTDLYKQKLRDIKQLGKDKPVTILNMNPFPLKINGGCLFPEEVAPCPIDKPYTMHVLREIRLAHKDNGCDMNNMMQIEPMPFVPQVLAVEYIREYIQSENAFGGVLCYLGDENPSTFKKDHVVQIPTLNYDAGELYVELVQRNFHEILASVKSRRNTSLVRSLQAANGWYENDHQRMNVGDNHRDMARLAKNEGLIEELPRWVMQDNSMMAKQPDPCPDCAAIPKPGAILCTNCNYIFDVIQAYKNTRIAYGAVQMDRLTAEEWSVVNKIKAERDRAKGKVATA